MRVLIINGPNLEMLSYRDRDVYGEGTLEWLEENLIKKNSGFEMVFTNFEGEFIEHVHRAIKEGYDGLIVNPGALSHYSYAVRDALEMFQGIKVEVHLSDVYDREDFRKNLVNKDVVDKMIVGRGILGYLNGIEYIQERVYGI